MSYRVVSTTSEYKKKKARIHELLGSKCVKCESSEDLHCDHIDYTTKSFSIMENWARTWKVLEVELKKCQLLCSKCHKDKTSSEGSLGKNWTNQPRQKHGTVWSYTKYKCRCVECKQAKSAYEKRHLQSRIGPLVGP